MRVLVSHEADDQVGRRLLAESPDVQVIPYDPATERLTGEQQAAEVFIPPYRSSFVSLLSDDGVPIERISLLVGHSGTTVTEAVYRHQIRPVVQDGASVIDRLFPGSAA